MRRAGLLRIAREATHGHEAGATARTILGRHKASPYDGNNRAGRPRPYTNRAPTRDAPTGNINHLGHPQGFKPRIARIAQIRPSGRDASKAMHDNPRNTERIYSQ